MTCSGRSYLPRWAGGVYMHVSWHRVSPCLHVCVHMLGTSLSTMRNGERGHWRTSQIWGTARERGMGRRWRDLWQTHVTCRPGELCTWCCGRLWGTTLEEEQPKVGGCWGLLSGLVFVASFQHGPALWTLVFYGFPRSPVPLPPLFIVFSLRWADASHMLRDHSVKSVTVTFPTATCSHSTKAFMQQM